MLLKVCGAIFAFYLHGNRFSEENLDNNFALFKLVHKLLFKISTTRLKSFFIEEINAMFDLMIKHDWKRSFTKDIYSVNKLSAIEMKSTKSINILRALHDKLRMLAGKDKVSKGI